MVVNTLFFPVIGLLLRHLEGAYAWSPKEAPVGFVKAPKTSFTESAFH